MALIRPARPEEAPAIAELVAQHAQRALMLPRPLPAVRESIDCWIVAVEGGRVLACGSLLRYTPELTEVRSLAVADEFKGQGLGSAVVKALIEEARRRGVRHLFALTRVAPFFQRLGFEPTEAARFPEKVWRDCLLCPIRARCDEVAVVMSFEPEAGALAVAAENPTGRSSHV